MKHADADVIIVGCGPVGMMTALRCAQRGLSVIALDRTAEIYPLPRAIGMDEEIQDLFARAGLIEQLRMYSTPLPGADFVDADGHRVVGLDIPPGTVGPLGHPPTVMFDQPSVERFLRQAVTDAGVDVRLEVEVVGITHQHDEGVRVELADGTALEGRWVVGADGASSTVRGLLDIALIDLEFDQDWLVVDATLLDPDLPLPRLARQHCDPARVVTFVPGHDTRRRWEFQLKPGETREQVVEPGFLRTLLDPWGRPDQLQVDRVAVYRFHGVVAERFHRAPSGTDSSGWGNVFLAGDAAHQMPPFNGQGMCSGMRDAENLAWKLAAVANGHVPPSLLDTYDEERRPHAAQQVAQSVDAGKLIDAIAADSERGLDAGYGRRKFPPLEHGLIEPRHRMVGLPLRSPADESFTVGDGWTLVHGPEANRDIPAALANLDAAVHRVDASAYGDAIAADDTIVVRPDRIVAAVTKDLASLAFLRRVHVPR